MASGGVRTVAAMLLLAGLVGCAERPASPNNQPPSATAASTNTTPATAASATATTPAYRAPQPTVAALRAAFDYDAARPLGVTRQPAVDDPQLGVRVIEVGYDDGSGGRATGHLVLPAGKAGRLPAVIFAHGSDGSSRTFLDEAKELAARGAVALLTNTSFAPRGRAEEDLAMIRTAVLIERRGLDLLAALPEVDPSRLAVVGHSWGATQAAILAGADSRLAAVVVAATGPRFSEFLWSNSGGAGDRAAYLDRLAVVDPVWQVAVPGRRAVLLQHGASDRIVGPAEAAELNSATAEPKEIRTYDAGHGLDREAAARRDRIEFLVRVLA